MNSSDGGRSERRKTGEERCCGASLQEAEERLSFVQCGEGAGEEEDKKMNCRRTANFDGAAGRTGEPCRLRSAVLVVALVAAVAGTGSVLLAVVGRGEGGLVDGRERTRDGWGDDGRGSGRLLGP